MRLLHVIQPLPALRPWWRFERIAPPCSGEVALQRVRDMILSGGEHVIAVLGGSQARALARRHGLADVHCHAPPLGESANAGPFLRALLRNAGPFDVMLGWGSSTDALRAKVITRGAAWLGIDARTGAMTDITFRPAPEDAGQLSAWPWNHAPQRASRREETSGMCTFSLLSDAASPGDAGETLMLASALQVSGLPTSILLPRASHGFDAARRAVLAGVNASRVSIVDHLTPATLARADVGIIAQRAHEPAAPFAWATHISAAIDAGVPVIASRRVVDALGGGLFPGIAQSPLSADLAREAVVLARSEAHRAENIAGWLAMRAANTSDPLAGLHVVLESRSLVRAVSA